MIPELYGISVYNDRCITYKVDIKYHGEFYLYFFEILSQFNTFENLLSLKRASQSI